MTFGSLFAGIGGFDLGLERAGMRCAWQVEVDAACRGVLARRFPESQQHDDVRTFDGAAAGRVDVLCGGFPCQDLSVAGRRAGLAGERSGLFFEFARIIGEAAPRWVVIENVPGLLSSRGGRDFGAVLGTLAELGYGFAYRVFDAQWFGLAQRRRRLFVVGCLGDWRSAAEVLFERDRLPWDSAPRRESGADVARCLTSRAGGNRRDGESDNLIPFDPAQITSGANRSNPEPGDPCHTLCPSAHPPAVAYRTTGNSGCYEQGDRIGALTTGTDLNQHVVAYQCHGGNVGEMGVLRSGNGNETGGVPFTVCEKHRPGGLGVGAAATTRVRRLMPVECERLMGFPDGWTDGQSDTARYRQLGNAVCPPKSEWLGRRLMEAE